MKIDKGLEAEVDGCQILKPMPTLDALLDKAVAAGIYGTKERSVISAANPKGIQSVVDQQFAVAAQVLAKGLMPIIEPEVTISIADKVEAEALLRDALIRGLDALPKGQKVMLKLTLPSVPNFYAPLVDHPNVLKVVALSGGYVRDLPNDPWGRPYQYMNPGIRSEVEILSFGADGQAGGEGNNADIGSWQ